MYYMIADYVRSFEVDQDLNIISHKTFFDPFHGFKSFVTEDEVLSYARNALHDIHKYYDKDPKTIISVDKEFGVVNCEIRFVDRYGFSIEIIKIERIEEREY